MTDKIVLVPLDFVLSLVESIESINFEKPENMSEQQATGFRDGLRYATITLRLAYEETLKKVDECENIQASELN